MSIGAIGGEGTIGLVAGFQRLPAGILTTINITASKIFQPLGEMWWSAHLGKTNDEDDGLIHTFGGAYLQWPMTLSWDGFLEIKTDQFIILSGVGLRGQSATINELRLTTTVDGKITDWLIQIVAKGTT